MLKAPKPITLLQLRSTHGHVEAILCRHAAIQVISVSEFYVYPLQTLHLDALMIIRQHRRVYGANDEDIRMKQALSFN